MFKKKEYSVRDQESYDNKNNPLTKNQKISLFHGDGHIRRYCDWTSISFNSQDQHWATLKDYFCLACENYLNKVPGSSIKHIMKVRNKTIGEIQEDLVDYLPKEIKRIIKSEIKFEEFSDDFLSGIDQILKKLD